jgi:LysM domain
MGFTTPPAGGAGYPSMMRTDGGGGGAPSADTTGTSDTSTSATAPSNTNVYNNLQGRDPDLIHTGETVKIEVNGQVKEHVVKNGETLSSIAKQNGVSVASLVQSNGMDASLSGKSNGQYFNVGAMVQPTPGAIQNNPPALPAATAAPVQPADKVADLQKPVDKETLDITLKNIAYLEGKGVAAGGLSKEDATRMRTLVSKAQSDTPLSAAELEQLKTDESLVKEMVQVLNIRPEPEVLVA